MASIVAQLPGEMPGDAAGETVRCAGDVDGDGRGDVLVGAPYNDSVLTEGGAAYLKFGASVMTP